MVASSSSLREEGEEVQDRPAGCFYPESARQAGDTEKCLQGSRTVKFLCQVARREVPYARLREVAWMLLHGVPSEHPSKLAGTSGLPGALPRKRPCPGAKHGIAKV